jgi:ribonuclease BN (tRNA processing enzyme)
MKLTFLGTRGEIEIRSRSHRRHSSLLVEHRDARIMIDCGADWLHRLRAIAPTAIVLTHGHDDHAAGLVRGAPCPAYATAATWKVLYRLPILDQRTMPLRKAVRIGGMRFSAFPVMHSLRAPAVGFRVPEKTRSFLLVCDDPDAPSEVFHHWAAFDIPADWRELREGHGAESLANGFRQAINDFGKPGYAGPCPPRGEKPHRYHFRLSELSEATCLEVIRLADPYVLEFSELVGQYPQ